MSQPRQRAIWGTQQVRAEDLEKDDVTRNRFGKWDVVLEVKHHDDGKYVTVKTECGGEDLVVRTVHLVPVQVVKPS